MAPLFVRIGLPSPPVTCPPLIGPSAAPIWRVLAARVGEVGSRLACAVGTSGALDEHRFRRWWRLFCPRRMLNSQIHPHGLVFRADRHPVGRDCRKSEPSQLGRAGSDLAQPVLMASGRQGDREHRAETWAAGPPRPSRPAALDVEARRKRARPRGVRGKMRRTPGDR
jgi:hypothetical protein